MSTDSTELTFVRCPSCRSLVPAISSRCRMCGATLDASSAAPTETPNADTEPKKSGRVRQRTMSDQSPEFKAAMDEARTEPAPVMEDTPKADASSEAVADDPLSAYIEEVEMEEDTPSSNGNTAALDTDNLEDEDPMMAAPIEKPAPVEPALKAAAPVAPPPPPVEEKTAPVAPKVVVETGPRRPGQGSGLSFSRPHENEGRKESREERPKMDNRPQGGNDRGRDDRRHAQDQNRGGQQSRNDRDQNRRDERRSDSRTDIPRHDGGRNDSRDQQQNRRNDHGQHQNDRRHEPRREERQQAHQQHSAPKENASRVDNRPAPSMSAAPQHAGGAKGKLFGWLVSYSDANGKAIELREGKFFISGKSLKESDLVIEDKSISMPHALVMVSGESGMMVQDLMSERGVFVRRGSSGQYQREEETCTVGHGDWIRFGDVEFLISLVPSEG